MNVFDQMDYKKYLKKVLDTKGQARGMRSKLARHLNCQTGFISQVLNNNTHFSLEHCIKISEFLNHDHEEKHFFLLLVQLQKAGTRALKEYYQLQLNEIINKRNEIKNRIKVDTQLREKDFITYYGQWYYAAIHVLVSISKYQTRDSICEKFNLPIEVTSNVLKFLVEKNLIIEHQGRYTIGQARIHLDRKSPMIFKHHTNWRLEAIKSLEHQNHDDLHYSSVITISNGDSIKIRNILLKAIEECEPVIIKSPEEEVFSFCMDFFKLGS